jgi:hypothetical protein
VVTTYGAGAEEVKSGERFSPSRRPTLTQLLGGLVSDAKALLRQEMALAKHEVHAELHKTKMAMVSLSLGLGLAALAGMLLIVMLVHLVNTVSELPLWSC